MFKITKVCRRIRKKNSVISPSPVYLPLKVFIYSLGMWTWTRNASCFLGIVCWTDISTCWSDPAATSTFTIPQCWPQQWREHCLSCVVLGSIIANTPCLQLQVLQAWIFHGVQFNQHPMFAYLSFSSGKAHNICNKIIQLNSMVKFVTTLAGGCCLPRLC